MVNRLRLSKGIPTYAGMDYLNHWIPACAGMTAGAIDPVRQTFMRIVLFIILGIAVCLRRQARFYHLHQ